MNSATGFACASSIKWSHSGVAMTQLMCHVERGISFWMPLWSTNDGGGPQDTTTHHRTPQDTTEHDRPPQDTA
eukprot:2242663-Pyramimonas_sp.AAC.1